VPSTSASDGVGEIAGGGARAPEGGELRGDKRGVGAPTAPRATAARPDAAEAAAHGAPRRDKGGGGELRAELRDPAPRALHGEDGEGTYRHRWNFGCAH